MAKVNDKTQGFMLYKPQADLVFMLPDADAGKLFKAIFLFQTGRGDEVDLESSILRGLYGFFQNTFTVDHMRYMETVEARRKGGAKGGRPKKVTEAEEEAEEDSEEESETLRLSGESQKTLRLSDETTNNSRVDEKPIRDRRRLINDNGEEDNIEKDSSLLPQAATLSEADLMEEFEELWKLYPRKAGKKSAASAYIKARKRKRNPVSYSEVQLGICRYNAYIKAKEIPEEYIKMGDTFFRGENWNDDFKAEALTDTRNKFNQFEQHEYNMDELERDLL